MSFPKVVTALLLAAALAACAKNSHAAAGVATGTPAPPLDQSTPVSGATAGNGGTMAAVPGGGRALPAAAAVPADLHCGSAQPVWVNRRKHVYHVATDRLYGRTKHGAYMCRDAAIAAGYRRAGKRS